MRGVTPDELARLQHDLLAAALGGALPDVQFAREGEAIRLARVNLAEPIQLDDLPMPVRVAPESPSQAARLEFAPPRVQGDELELALQVRAPAPRDGRMLPLSTVTHRYRREAGGWTSAEPPAAASS